MKTLLSTPSATLNLPNILLYMFGIRVRVKVRRGKRSVSGLCNMNQSNEPVRKLCSIHGNPCVAPTRREVIVAQPRNMMKCEFISQKNPTETLTISHAPGSHQQHPLNALYWMPERMKQSTHNNATKQRLPQHFRFAQQHVLNLCSTVFPTIPSVCSLVVPIAHGTLTLRPRKKLPVSVVAVSALYLYTSPY